MSHTIHAITVTHSLCNWKFASPDLPHLFVSLSQPPPLWQTLALCVYESISFKKKIFIYLAVLGLRCGTLALYLWHAGYRACGLGNSSTCWMLVPQKELNPHPPALQGGFLTSGSSVKSHDYVSICYICMFVLDSAYK